MSPVIRIVGAASLSLAPLGGCRIDAPSAATYSGESSTGSTGPVEDGDSTTGTTTSGAVDTISGSADSGTQTSDTGPEPEPCGNGMIEAGEDCDDAGESATCDEDCTLVECGDGVANTTAGELCDDGGESAACNADCTPWSCGDGVLNRTAGELCDDAGPSAACDDDCTLAECGDGVTNSANGETCDGGDLGGGSCFTQGFDGGVLGCSLACTYDTAACFSCGDGVVDLGEQCDDGVESPGCDADCTFAVCGDALVNAAAGEQCDDGAETVSCDSDCTPPACGDAVVNVAVGEQCDGSQLAGSSCASLGFDSGTLDCAPDCMGFGSSGCGTCGNGVIDGIEDCDDANEVDGDGCPSSCVLNRYIFVSSAMYTGNLGGLAGADAECQALAEAAGLPGTYMAWLSTDDESPLTRMSQATVPYVRPDGAEVAPSWAGLVDGNLAVPINMTETGGPAPIGDTGCAGGGFPTVWSATFFNGTSAGADSNCSGWTSVVGSGVWGQADATDSAWTAWCSGGTCSWVSPIYCVQQ